MVRLKSEARRGRTPGLGRDWEDDQVTALDGNGAVELTEPLADENDPASLAFRHGNSESVRAALDIAMVFCRNGADRFVVKYSDAAEFADLEGEAKAKAWLDRYVSFGSERWGYTWVADGSRVALGHAYIGRCERTHYLVLLTETEDRIEHRIAFGGDISTLFTAPEDATAVTLDVGAYEGDLPSDSGTEPVQGPGTPTFVPFCAEPFFP